MNMEIVIRASFYTLKDSRYSYAQIDFSNLVNTLPSKDPLVLSGDINFPDVN